MALAGPSRSCKAVASLGILECGSVLPQIPVSYWLSPCSGGNSCRLYRKAANWHHTQACTPCGRREGFWGLEPCHGPQGSTAAMLTSTPPRWKMWWGCFCPSGYFHAAFVIVRKVVILTSDITPRNSPQTSLFQVRFLAIQNTANSSSTWWGHVSQPLCAWG